MINNFVTENILQILFAAIGSIGFALSLNVKKSRILLGGIGGGGVWCIYIICTLMSFSTFTSSLFSASSAYLYSAILSKVKKAPINVFFAPTTIPLLPGGNLYYTINALIQENKENFYLYGKETLQIALGLSIGFIICSVIWRAISETLLNSKGKNYFSKN